MKRNFHYYFPLVLQKIGYVIFLILHEVFVRLEIRDTENIQNLTSPIILATNHTSELDVTALPLIFPMFSKIFPIYFVTNQTEKYRTFGWRSYIYGGVFFNCLGGYAVYSGHKDYAMSLEDHIKLLKNGQTLWIAPEGKRTRDGNMNPARGGLGFLVHTTQAVVLPIAINTFFNMSFWDFITFKRKVVITIGKPMKPGEIININNPTVTDFREGSQRVLDRIHGMM
ncbi:MAG: lysophospholipid acyltransferase family protein [Patescibacteria group bacterium]